MINLERMIKMSIRDYVVDNFKDEDIDGLTSAIEDSIQEQDEMTLPGLGVLFEILWKNSNTKEKNNIKQTIFTSLKKGN